MAQYYYDPEKLGRRRLPDGKPFRAVLNGQSSLILSSLFDLLPSNYPKTESTNLAILYRVLGREAAREQLSMQAISSDSVFTTTRIEYLHQILAERLFLNEQVSPVQSDDISYRNYLIAIKDAYLKGSSKANIENLINGFTKQNVSIKELYLQARNPNSSIPLTDTHKMVVDVFVDQLLGPTLDLATLDTQLKFFIDLVRPAHVLYDTRYIWTDTYDANKTHDIIFGDTGSGCVPAYITTPFGDKVYLAQQIIIVPPSSAPGVHRIASIHPDTLTLYLPDDSQLIVEPGINGTKIFGLNGKVISFSDLHIEQYIQFEALPIPGDFNFYWTPPDLITNPYSRFYKNIYRKPAFQEFVKKQMDSKGRFPIQIKSTPTTLCDRWVQDTLVPMYEDLRKDCTDRPETPQSYEITLAQRMWNPRFSWGNTQGSPLSREQSGDIFSFTLDNTPLTDSSGNPATVNDIAVFKDSTALIGAVQAIDSSSGYVSLFNTPDYWDGTGVPLIGSDLRFNYYYGTGTPSSTTYAFGISQWQLPNAPISDGSRTNYLAMPSDVAVSVDGTAIPGAVKTINAIPGQVSLQDETSFWVVSPLGRVPQIGDTIQFQYYQTGNNVYSMLWDDMARDFDGEMILDGAGNGVDPSIAPAPRNPILEIGYKFRADLMHHASVLNSPDTLLLNNYQKPALRASLINQQAALNHFNYFFSPEHLYDTSANIVLNDQYLDKPNAPILNLREGIPPFQKTFGYQPGLATERKLQDVRQNHHPLMYCDLLLKEFRSGDSVPLSSICDRGTIGFKIRFKEQLDQISECAPWMLFDTYETEDQETTIPGERTGIPNLRVPAKKLRSNFILRETTPTYVTDITSTFVVPSDATVGSFQLPEYITYQPAQGDSFEFPALPVMKNSVTIADISDVVARKNGVPVPIDTFDPILGNISLTYAVSAAHVTFTYKIKSTGLVQIVDSEGSRTFDEDKVLPAGCYDGYKKEVGFRYTEYINFLSDYSTGIKFTYYNRVTNQIEEHVFSGPVFETYDSHEDEISAPESFPEALVRIRNPISSANPINLNTYDFINSPSIRVRKKMLRELLPDRTFRTLKIMEALPV